MAEFVRVFSERENLKALLDFCLVTGPKSMYAEYSEPEPDDLQMIAQWDTGATYTVISKDVIELLGLKPTGRKMNVVGANGVYKSDTYIVNLHFSEGIVFENLLVAEMVEGIGASVLVGLDVILQSDFIIQPQGDNVLLKFRHPSEGEKPFTAKAVSLFEEMHESE